MILPIKKFPWYFVSSKGTVYSKLPTSSRYKFDIVPRILNQSDNGKGYKFVRLERGGKPHKKYVHRLVLENFVGPCPKGHQTRHLNGVRHDNRRVNLSWGTPSQNQMDRERHGTSNKGRKRRKISTH